MILSMKKPSDVCQRLLGRTRALGQNSACAKYSSIASVIAMATIGGKAGAL